MTTRLELRAMLYKLPEIVGPWPEHVPLVTRLELTQAVITLPHREVLPTKPFCLESNAAATMMRCVDEYAHGTFASFDLDWVYSIAEKHESLLRQLTEQTQ